MNHSISSPHHVVLKIGDVSRKIKRSRSAIYAMVAAGQFPKPIKLGLRATGWLEAEVDQWIEQLMDARAAA